MLLYKIVLFIPNIFSQSEFHFESINFLIIKLLLIDDNNFFEKIIF